MTRARETKKQRIFRSSMKIVGIAVGLLGVVLVIVGIATQQPVLLVIVSSLLAAGGSSIATMYSVSQRSAR